MMNARWVFALRPIVTSLRWAVRRACVRVNPAFALLALLAVGAAWGAAPQSAKAACSLPHALTNGQTADADQVMGNFNAVVSCVDGPAANPLVMGFVLGSGATGNNVGPILIASRAGHFTKCKVVIKASDPSNSLTFRIKQNGADIFASDPTLAAGTASGTVLTFTGLTSSPLTVAGDDLFTVDVTSGTAFWQVTIQLE
jgi:hypothetical protein